MDDISLLDVCNEFLSYDEETGLLFWKKQKGAAAKDTQSGSMNDGYWTIRISGKLYNSHRIIWLMSYGYMPTMIDHIDHDRSNNKLSNLREVSREENQRNMRLNKKNVSGVCGVSFSKERQKWVAAIMINGKQTILGRFHSFDDAVCVRKEAEIKHGFHENHGWN